MGGDLNLKKSWHPHLAKNQERVWKEEKKALEERKLIDKLNKEREEERAIEELQKLQEAHGGTTIQKRVDWMYQGPGANEQVTEEREAYLLGKRRIDNLLKASEETQVLKKGAAVGVDAFTGGPGVGVSASDTKKKVLEDPLLMIQKSKMEAQIKAAREAQKMEKVKERREKERSKKHRHHRRDRSHSDDEDDRRRHRHHRRDRSRSDDEDDQRRHKRSRRDRSRSRSDSDDIDRRERHRRRSRSPRRRDDRERRDHRRHRSRSRSPYHSRRDDDRQGFRRRSRSPRRSSDHYERPAFRRRSPSPRRKSYGDQRPAPRRRSPSPKREEDSLQDDDKAAKLAAMQADATSLEAQRLERVRLLEIEDAAEEAKHRQDRDGGHRFISKVRRGAGEGVELGDALARGRRGGAVEV